MIFVDTGAFLALHLEGDVHHDAALEGWRRIEEDGERCLTTGLVVLEAL